MKNKINLYKDIAMYTLYAVLGLLIVFIIMISAFPEMALNTFGTRVYIAKYDTMEPAINPFDLVFINTVDTGDLQEGDLITFETDVNFDGTSEMVTYYIYDIDTNNGEKVFRVNSEGGLVQTNTLLTSDDIIGGYSFRLPGFGRAVEFIASPFGIAAILVNAGVITAIVLIFKNSKKEANDQSEEKIDDNKNKGIIEKTKDDQ